MGQILYHTALLAPSLQDADPWSIDTRDYSVATLMDLGSVNAPPPLEHRDPGVGWSCSPIGLGCDAWHRLG